MHLVDKYLSGYVNLVSFKAILNTLNILEPVTC